MALSALAGALAAFAAGVVLGVGAVSTIATAIGRARRKPAGHPAPGRPEPIRLCDNRQLLVDLGQLGVTVARGPAELVDQILLTALADLGAQLASRSFCFVVAGFAGSAPAGASACSDLATALDLVTARAVTARRGMRADSDIAATVLVSRAAPTPAELKLLVDLAAEPGVVPVRGSDPQEPPAVAALLPWGAPGLPPGARVLELRHDRTRPGAFTARLRPRRAGPAEAGLRIGVLGALTINGRPAALLPAQSELIVALALHGRGGLSNQQLCRLLGADPGHPRPSDSLRQLIVRTRRQLGRASDGGEWIEHRGGGQYALHPAATVDWADFEALAARAIASRDARQLTQALAMVRGQPFAGCFYWWLDLGLVETIRARVVDAAETLAKLALVARDPAAAARAARTGLVTDDAAERLWRVLMRAEHAAGNMAGVREAWTRCLRAVAEISADGLPEQATAAVYQQLGGR